MYAIIVNKDFREQGFLDRSKDKVLTNANLLLTEFNRLKLYISIGLNNLDKKSKFGKFN